MAAAWVPPRELFGRDNGRRTGSAGGATPGAEPEVANALYLSHARHPCRRAKMPQYRHRDARGELDDIMVIEDKSMLVNDNQGGRAPGYEFVDSRTVRAHPAIIDALLADSERLWTMEELLAAAIG